MSEQATKQDLQELTNTILDAVNSMYASLCKQMDEKIEQSENRIMAQIENGIEKQAQMNGEAISGILERLDRVESTLGEVKEAVTRHDDELFIIRKAK